MNDGTDRRAVEADGDRRDGSSDPGAPANDRGPVDPLKSEPETDAPRDATESVAVPGRQTPEDPRPLRVFMRWRLMGWLFFLLFLVLLWWAIS